MGAGLLGGGVAGERSELQQRRRRGGGAVQVAVGDDGAFVGAAGAAVGGVQVLDERPAARRCEALAWAFPPWQRSRTCQMELRRWPYFGISGPHPRPPVR